MLGWRIESAVFNRGGCFDWAMILSHKLSKALRRWVGCVLILMTANALSAPPAPYDRWQNQGGRITATCPTGFSCTTTVVGPGFLQRWLIDRQGNRYVQMIMQDGNATDAGRGRTTVESFVQANNDNNLTGIASKHSIQESGVFEYNAEINTGWASGNGPEINLIQRNLDTMTQGTSIDTTFTLEQERNPADDVQGYRYRIDQALTNTAVLNGLGAQNDRAFFTMVRAGGSLVTAGSANLPPGGGMGGMAGMGMGGAAQMNPPVPAVSPPGLPSAPPPDPVTGEPNFDSTPGNTGGGGGGAVSWNQGDDIQAIWIGLNCPGCANMGMGMMGGTPGQFSYQAYENLSGTPAAAMTRSYTNSAPFNWNGAFGTAPTAP